MAMPGIMQSVKKKDPTAESLRIARDAKRAAAAHDESAIPELAANFHRLIADAATLDKGCIALTEIAAALYALDHHDSDIYLRGIHHVQIEGSFGRPTDAAVQLRSHCALGLTQTHHPDTAFELVKLLTDAEPGARVGAARAIGMLPTEAAALVLRFKVLSGDAVPDIIAECFSSLLAADAARSMDFVAHYMSDHDDAIAEAAVLALGDSRLPAAVEALKEQWTRSVGATLRRVLLLALATARRESSLEFLLKLAREENARTATEAIQAMRIYRHDSVVRERLSQIVETRPELRKTFQEEF